MALTNDFKVKNGLTVTDSISAGSCIEADSFEKHGGTSSQFLKADGSVDSTAYGTVACICTTAAGLDNAVSFGTVDLSLDLNELSTSTTDGDGDFFVVVDSSGNQKKLTKGNINNSGFNNDAGFATGTVTCVLGCTGITVTNGTGNACVSVNAAQPDITSLGTLTSLTVDDITLNGSTISDGGDFTLDIGGDITIDAGGGNVYIKDDGTTIGQFFNSSSDFVIKSEVNNKDLVFKGKDNGADITALTLDMSDAGTATFNHNVNLPDGGQLNIGANADLYLTHDDNNGYFYNNKGDLFIDQTANDSDIVFKGTDGGSDITALRLDMSDGGTAIFNNHVNTSLVYGTTDLNLGYAGGTSGIFIKGSTALAGNVGIGTTHPTTKLQVVGDSLVTGNSTIYGNLSVTGDFTCLETTVSTTSALSVTNTGTGPALYVCQAGVQPVAHFIDANGGDVVIADDGKVGIGTFTPSSPLHISSDENVVARFHSTDANATLYLSDNGTSNFSTFKRTSDNLAILENGGNVGIGTSSPAAKLDVVGGHIRLDAGQSLQWDNTHERIEQSDGHLEFFVNNGEAMTLDTNGLGIGTTSPSQKLHVKGIGMIEDASSTSFGTLQFGTDTSRYLRGNSAEIQFGSTIQQLHFQKTNAPAQLASSAADGVTAIQLLARNVHTSANLLEVVNGNGQTADFVIDSSGNVGIGTITPTEKLNVIGNIALSGTSGSAGPHLKLEGTYTTWELENQYTGGATNDMFRIRNTASSSDALVINRLTNNVGIGDTTPSYKLDVAGDINSQSDILSGGVDLADLFATGASAGTITGVTAGDGLIGGGTTGSVTLNVSAGDGVQVTANCVSADSTVVRTTGTQSIGGVKTFTDNVGIGTNNPTNDLHVAGTMQLDNSVSDAFKIRLNGGVGLALDHNSIKSTNSGTDIEIAAGRELILKTYDGGFNDAVRIDTSGNVGIGTTNPAKKLHVLNSTNEAQIRLGQSGSGSYDLGVYANDTFSIGRDADTQEFNIKGGNVGIGTASPKGKLHVLDGTAGSYTPNSEADTVVIESSEAGGISLIGTGSASVRKQKIVFGTTGDTTGAVVMHDPNNAFMAVGTTTASNYLKFLTGDSTEAMRLAADGNVGIGCTAPTQKLAVAGDGLFTSDLTVQGDLTVTGDFTCLETTVSVTSALSVLNTGTGPALIVNQTGSNDIVDFRDDGTSAFYIEDGGNVGINDTNPNERLDVSGNINVTGSYKIDDNIVLDTGRCFVGLGIDMGDNHCIKLGAGDDLVIKHNSTDSYIENYTGDLHLANYANDKDIIFHSDNGSGGITEYLRLDGSEARLSTKVNNRFDDNARLELGTSGDLDLYHNGTDSIITNATGDLYIQNSADDKDIYFQSDNGSGGMATYIQVDGSAGCTVAYCNFRFNDCVCANFGTSNDLKIYHNGTESFIGNYTGNLTVFNEQDDGDILFKSDNGSGGTDTYFKLDGASERLEHFKNDLHYDNVRAQFGDSADLQIFHDGSNSYIADTSGTGSLIVNTDAFLLKSANNGESMMTAYQDGAVNLMHNNTTRLSTTSTGVDITGTINFAGGASTANLSFGDNDQIQMGTGNDLRIYHDGSHSYVKDSGTGVLKLLGSGVSIQNAAGSENMLVSQENGSVDLYYDSNKKFATTTDGIQLYGNGYLDMPDNGRLRMGASYDLAMYHDGTHSYLTNNVTGSLYIQSGNSVQIESSAGENMIVGSANGAVQLYYDNCSKLQTTCSGISVCGNALVSGHVCATTKSFVVDNPTTGGQLRYSVVEGNEHGVTVRGSTCSGTIELPDEWDWLVDEDSVTAQLTPVGSLHQPYVVSQDNKQVVVCSDGCYNYNIYGTRKDVEPLEVNIL